MSGTPSGGRSMRRRLARLLLIIAAIYAGWCVLLYVMQDRMMFPRDLTRAPTPEEGIPRIVERVWIDQENGTDRTEAWLIAPRVEAGERAPAVILTHGNAELIDECLDDAAKWTARGYLVALCEYRGYGRSGGSPGEAGIVRDVAALYDRLRSRESVDPERIYAHGRSLGSGVAAQLAARRPVAGLILESPFKSAASFAMRFGAPPMLVKSPFRTDRALRAMKTPVIILHSVDDEIIPIAHARALKKARPDVLLIEMTGGHNSGLSNRAEYWEAIDRWQGKARTAPR